MRSLIGLLLCAAALGAACSGSDNDSTSDGSIETASATVEVTAAEASVEQRFPDIIDATAEQTNLGWSFDVTVSSPYDSADRYADAWRIVGPDGTVYGTRELAHDHAAEQPFTRTIQAVEIADDVDVVTIEGRDQANGWGGGTFELTLTRS
jgi:hypothetical protein